MPVVMNKLFCKGGKPLNKIKITTPLRNQEVEKLKAGDEVFITGYIYTARDQAHKRMIDSLKKGEKLPFDIHGQILYYVGPAPTPPGEIIGSAGPTTSGRMDSFTPQLLQEGLKGMIGKGERSPEVIQAIIANKGIYFAAIGGAGALLKKCIKTVENIAYEDLGTEAIRKLWVEDFPAIVVNDTQGNDLYRTEKNKYTKK